VELTFWKLAALRGAFAGHALKSLVRDHDVLISTYKLCDFGVPGIQCVADFSWDEVLRRHFASPPDGVRNLFDRSLSLRRCYLRLCRSIAPPLSRDLFAGEDLIVANSHWTAAKLIERYGAIARVVYLPVACAFPSVSDEHRRSDFVCIGRISPEKRIERMIDIIGAVRKRGHNVRIRIVGLLERSLYANAIVALAGRHHDWVLLEGRQVGPQKAKTLAQCRYGIHGREGEAFGIGVAEMVKAGCITFAPSEGGPAEILADQALLYQNNDDAVEKIVAVLDHEALRSRLISHLRNQAAKFSSESFMNGLRETVDSFLSRLDLTQRSRVTRSDFAFR
jgi:glycosyltransferase involved in cell wall biosynthesis